MIHKNRNLRKKHTKAWYAHRAKSIQFSLPKHEKVKKVENAPEVFEDGGGKLQGEKAPKWYKEMKEKRIAYLNSHFGMPNKYGNHFAQKDRHPWFMLTKGKCYNFEERTFDWGTETKPFRVDSEIKQFNCKQPQPFDKEDALIKHKMSRWDIKHPKPCKDDDLFKEEFLTIWEKDRKEHEDQVKTFVHCYFHPLIVKGRFKTKDDFVEIQIGQIKDKTNERATISCETPSKITSQLLNIVDSLKSNPNFVAGKIYNEDDMLLCIPASHNIAA